MEGIASGAVDFAVALIALVVVVLVWRRRRAAQAEPVSVPLELPLAPPQVDWLDAEQRARWQQQVQRFLREKRFIACAGQKLTDGQRGLIAGYACLLRLQAHAQQVPLFPTVHEVLVYPDAFLVPAVHEPLSEEGLELVDDEPDERIGEHGPGQVVLSWTDVEAALAGDTVNVVVHEFAHALDSEHPGTEGAPPMADYAEWAKVMGEEFARLQRHRRPPVLDPYGAESPAEFWCVVTEAFFQQPAALARHHAKLFALLAGYFELRPALAGDRDAA